MSVLADLVVQSRSRVTHTAKRLETRGWVRREPTPEDGRGVALALTAAGRRLVESAAPMHVAVGPRHFIDLLTARAGWPCSATPSRRCGSHLVPGARAEDEIALSGVTMGA